MLRSITLFGYSNNQKIPEVILLFLHTKRICQSILMLQSYSHRTQWALQELFQNQNSYRISPCSTTNYLFLCKALVDQD